MIVWNQEAKESYVKRTDEMYKRTRAERKKLTLVEYFKGEEGTGSRWDSYGGLEICGQEVRRRDDRLNKNSLAARNDTPRLEKEHSSAVV